MKSAIVKPLLKKSSLDPELFKNYRPVSNLSFISKLVEKAAAIRFREYLTSNKLNEVFQSAYKANHSTETALLRVKNDILTAVDHGKAVMLILLDLSAAFDTIDHDTLLNLMKNRLGISGSALDWVRSYLSYRTQVVSISEARSEVVCLIFGVPQGSVLGPMLFTLYILPIGDIARKNNVNFHGCADDTQLYVTFKSTNSEETKLSIDRAGMHT